MGNRLTLVQTISAVVAPVIGVFATIIGVYLTHCLGKKREDGSTPTAPPTTPPTSDPALQTTPTASSTTPPTAPSTTPDPAPPTTPDPAPQTTPTASSTTPPATPPAPPVEMVRASLIRVGTWGYPMHGENFNFHDLHDIKTIKIVSNTVIHSIEVQHIKNQELLRTSRVGREEGSSQEVVLKDGEYINGVTGYYGPSADETGTLNSLTFHTNKNKYGPYGFERLSDQSTEFEVRGGKIVGFYGNAKEYIHAIGFHVLPVVDPVTKSSTVYVGRWGEPHYGEPFSHDDYNDIKTIRISSGRVIDSIQVQYIKGGEHVWTPKLGGGDPEGTPPNISETKELKDGEYITEVSGCYGFFYGKKHICYLTFHTNQSRRFGPYGTRYNGRNNKEITPFSVKGGKIVGFHGTTTRKYIYSIGFYLSDI